MALHQDEVIYESKRALSVGLTGGSDSINGRKYFKLRDLAREPTQMREVTYGGMLHACGIVTPNQIHVRVYINKIPYGLFAMTDYTRVKTGLEGNTREVGTAKLQMAGHCFALFVIRANDSLLCDQYRALRQLHSSMELLHLRLSTGSKATATLITSAKIPRNTRGTSLTTRLPLT